MKVIFTQNCTMSIGNMTVKAFCEGELAELEGTALAKALADGRCIPAPEKPEPKETKQEEPVAENKSMKKPNKKAK